MSTLAWILILLSVLVFRAVAKGRVMNIGEDASDAFLALLSGNTGELTAVLARTGESNKPDQAVIDAGSGALEAMGEVAASASLVVAAKSLGSKAQGYRFGATGPDYYDCSGLMWRACQKIGYKGARFTTFNIAALKAFQRVTGRVELSVKAGDIVCWPTHHMGVVTGPNRFYSARNPKSGISEADISGFRNEAPIYLRYVGNS